MTCKHCGKKIETLDEFSTRYKCSKCERERVNKYNKGYRQGEKYKSYMREYWKGGPVKIKSNSDFGGDYEISRFFAE